MARGISQKTRENIRQRKAETFRRRRLLKRGEVIPGSVLRKLAAMGLPNSKVAYASSARDLGGASKPASGEKRQVDGSGRTTVQLLARDSLGGKRWVWPNSV